MENNSISEATLGGGCFWCTEAVFQQLQGVEEVISGYSGGRVPGRPTYREVCSGLTGHAEVVRVRFRPEVLSFEELLTIFMSTHDPTTLNRQGADRGSQYRSVIFYHDQDQRATAERVVEQMQPYFDDPIVTEISPLPEFFAAEADHQDFYLRNPNFGYCNYVIDPKLKKLRDGFASKLRT